MMCGRRPIQSIKPQSSQRTKPWVHISPTDKVELVQRVQVQEVFLSVIFFDIFIDSMFVIFVRGGDVYPWLGSTRYLGGGSNYWASTAYPSAYYAYFQDFDGANVYPSDIISRARAFPVLCLVL